MADLIYRGVAHKPAAPKTETLADQMRRPTLIYRGVEHDGTRPIETDRKQKELIYRGVRFA